MNIAVVGLGYWGPNLVRNFAAHPGVGRVVACDPRPERRAFIKARFPETAQAAAFEDVLADDSIEAVALAVPVDRHHELARRALDSGRHVWLEKPLTSSVAQAEDLMALAQTRRRTLFVDHTFIYTGAVRKIRQLVEAGELGDVLYFDSVRINLGLFQHDVNVVWDLAPHDLSIMLHVMGAKPTAVSAHGIAQWYAQENIAHIALYFPGRRFAHFHVNWTSPVKIRKIIVGGTKKMLVYDDLETSEKIKIYDAGVNVKSEEGVHDLLVQYRTGDMHSPRVDPAEALSGAVAEFMSAIAEKRAPLTGGAEGLDVVRILEASEKSIKQKGRLIEL
jgi:predicted dehydrogenase